MFKLISMNYVKKEILCINTKTNILVYKLIFVVFVNLHLH